MHGFAVHDIETASDDNAGTNPDLPGWNVLPHQIADGGGPQQRSILKWRQRRNVGTRERCGNLLMSEQSDHCKQA